MKRAEPSWQSVTTFSADYSGGGIGEHAETTDAFTVTGTKFRLKWIAGADGEYVGESEGQVPAEFRFSVNREGEDTPFKSVEDNGPRYWNYNDRTGETIVSGTGRFYLELRVMHIDGWGIEVHGWR